MLLQLGNFQLGLGCPLVDRLGRAAAQAHAPAAGLATAARHRPAVIDHLALRDKFLPQIALMTF